MRAVLLLSLALLTLGCREAVDKTLPDEDGDGFDTSTDCDDADAAVNPDAAEVCNGIDDDCDGEADVGAVDAPTWYRDADEDGWGTALDDQTVCEQPSGYVSEQGDCDDGDAAWHPGAEESDCTDPNDYNCDGSVGYADADDDGWPACEDCNDAKAQVNPGEDEVCNEVDDDCDGEVDEEALDASTFYADADADGFGDPASTTEACEAPEGYTADDTDCDDTRAQVNPAANELCNELDDDCDGTVDEDEAVDALTWYQDYDADGYGGSLSAAACEQPSGYVSDSTDCDDGDASSYPGGTEVCDDADNDCNGDVDDGATDASTWYPDADADSYGDATSSTESCDRPSGYVADDSDCDDTDADVRPGQYEVCNSIDDDCDGTVDEDEAVDASTWYADADSDGYGDVDSTDTACTAPSGYVSDATDCDDSDAAAYPGADEYCNSVDDDCDGDTDEDSAVDATTFYADLDGDGYGSSTVSTTSCTMPSGYAATDDDCDESDDAIHPGADETCNGEDDDCDGDTDEDAIDASTWYADADSDGYGDPDVSEESCEAPSATTDDATDCDDSDDAVSPAEEEVCGDGIDNDCDGEVDGFYCDLSNGMEDYWGLGTAALSITADTTIDTDTGEISGSLRAAGTGEAGGIWFETVVQSSGPDLGVFVVDGLSIATATTLSVTGDSALVLLSSDDVDIAGTLDLTGGDGAAGVYSGPNAGGTAVGGGADGGDGSDSYYRYDTAGSGTGGGALAVQGVHYGNGGGGAGHCYGGGGGAGDRSTVAGSDGTATAGGAGGYGGGDGGRGGDGGDPYGDPSLEPLLAGSGGAGGVSDTDTGPMGSGSGGGAGGGAVQIVTNGTLDVSGTIDASGGDAGIAYGGGGGGGSGGAVLLEAVDLDISGAIYAEGGHGGHGCQVCGYTSSGGSAGSGTAPEGGGGAIQSGGGGGATGYILLRYQDSISTTGTVSPSTSSDCAAEEAI